MELLQTAGTSINWYNQKSTPRYYIPKEVHIYVPEDILNSNTRGCGAVSINSKMCK